MTPINMRRGPEINDKSFTAPVIACKAFLVEEGGGAC